MNPRFPDELYPAKTIERGITVPHKEYQRRIVAIRAFLEMRVCLANFAEAFDLSVEEVLVGMAIRLGSLERKPLDISDLAEITGLKYSSVHRYLKTLQKRGIVREHQEGRRAVQYLAVEHEDPLVTKAYANLIKSLRQAGKELDKI